MIGKTSGSSTRMSGKLKTLFEWVFEHTVYKTIWFRWYIVGPLLFFRYRKYIGKYPHLFPPRTFNEKLLYRLIFDRRKLLPKVVGKYEGREYVEEKFGHTDILVDMIGAVSSSEELKRLPLPEKFIAKGSHLSGLVEIFDGSAPVDVDALGKEIDHWCRRRFSKMEFGYRDIRRVVLIEHLLDENGAIPSDYKFFCFDGAVHFIQVDGDRFSGHKRDYFDRDWNHLDVTCSYPQNPIAPAKPHLLAQMIQVAETLSAEFDFVRVDLYQIGNTIKFGELSPYPGGAKEKFVPESWDMEFGNRWNLPVNLRKLN
jgi:hypothetical protein